MTATTRKRTLAGTFYQETPGQQMARVTRGGARKPMRTIQELAQEFGVPTASLAGKMRWDANSPKAKFRTGSFSSQTNTWYDADEVRKWWKDVS